MHGILRRHVPHEWKKIIFIDIIFKQGQHLHGSEDIEKKTDKLVLKTRK